VQTSELALPFESLGDNCEFGLVQRVMGAEPLGLLRFAFTAPAVLDRLLATDFAGVDDPAEASLEREANDEVMLCLKRFDMRTHTNIFGRHGEEPVILAEQVRALGFLRRKLLDDLRDGEKIFVRKGEIRHGVPVEDQAGPLALREALGRHGPGWLLWVTLADATLAPGCVEVLAPRLMRGAIPRFAHYERAQDACYGAWEDVCAGAAALRSARAAPGASLAPAPRQVRANLLTPTAWFDTIWWTNKACAASFLATSLVSPPGYRPGCDDVIGHSLVADTDHVTGSMYGRYVPDGLVGGMSYVVSAWVWISLEFEGSHVGMVFDGFASLVTANADLQQRCCWQQVWARTVVPDGLEAANPRLYIIGKAGSLVYSSGWKLEQGRLPS